MVMAWAITLSIPFAFVLSWAISVYAMCVEVSTSMRQGHLMICVYSMRSGDPVDPVDPQHHYHVLAATRLNARL